MRKKNAVKLALVLIPVLMLTGCTPPKALRNFKLNPFAKTNINHLSLVSPLSQKEVIDYYKQALEYDAVVKRSVKENKAVYELNSVEGEFAKFATEETKKVEAILGQVFVTPEQKFKYENVSGYIKAVFDDKVLTRTNKYSVSQALGHVFVDAEYTMTPTVGTGTFTEKINYLGINGVFYRDVQNEIQEDLLQLNGVRDRVKHWLEKNPDYVRFTTNNPRVRKPTDDIWLLNTQGGTSASKISYMPPLQFVYNPVAPAGTISGNSIYPGGAFTMADKFKFDRNKLKGTATLRYVFKRDLLKPDKLIFTNIYPLNFKYEYESPKKEDEIIVVPDFLFLEAQKIIERADRMINNRDIPALMSGKVFEDCGLAVLIGYAHNHTNIERYMSKPEEVLARNGNFYLTSFERMVQDGFIGAQALGTYIEKGLCVVQQVDSDFVISDTITLSREMIKEPGISLDETILKRLASLNLQGEIPSESKEEIKVLLAKLYAASTERSLSKMYECFNDDTTILSLSHREYLNSQLRSWLVREGVKTPATYMGTVTQWVGGAENQAELFAEELINYEGRDSGQYMTIYYLVSKFKDQFVIDEMKVVESRTVSGTELESIKSALQSNAIAVPQNQNSEGTDESKENDVEETKEPENKSEKTPEKTPEKEDESEQVPVEKKEESNEAVEEKSEAANDNEEKSNDDSWD